MADPKTETETKTGQEAAAAAAPESAAEVKVVDPAVAGKTGTVHAHESVPMHVAPAPIEIIEQPASLTLMTIGFFVLSAIGVGIIVLGGRGHNYGD